MNPSVRRIAPFVVSVFTVSSAMAAGFDPTQFSTGDFHTCAPTGKGGIDSYLNSLKNRDKPPTTARLYTVDSLYKATPVLPSRKVARKKWTPAQRALAAKWESVPVMVEGYLVHLPFFEKPEACNCGDGIYRDYHMWLGQTP